MNRAHPEENRRCEPRPLFAFREVSKRFPGVVALRSVSFELAAGSGHALRGENGAGKRTLGKILAGLYRPDAGRIEIEGRTCRFRSPGAAQRAGIGLVYVIS